MQRIRVTYTILNLRIFVTELYLPTSEAYSTDWFIDSPTNEFSKRDVQLPVHRHVKRKSNNS